MYSPVTQGESFQLTGPLVLDNGLPLQNLLNVTSAQLVFAPDDFAQPSGDLRFAATGTVIVNATTNTYSFAPSSLDLTKLVAGIWKIQGVVTYSSGGVRYSTPIVFGVNPPL